MRFREIRGWLMRFFGLFHRKRREREFAEELESHLVMHIEDNLRAGLSSEEARRLALIKLGGVTLTQERCREQGGLPMLETFWQDLSYGMRMLRKNPGFTVIVLLTVGLGIGANTAIFSVVDAILLKPLPVKKPEQLVLFNWQAGQAFRTVGIRGYGRGSYPPGMQGSSSFQYRIFEKLHNEKLQEKNCPISHLFAFAPIVGLNMRVDGQAEKAEGQVVSGDYYAGLGVQPLLGRVITPVDDNVAAPPVAVLSHRYWQARFDADPSVIGKRIELNKITFTIIGITEPVFNGTLQVGQHPGITVPIAFEPELESDNPSMDRPGRPGRWWVVLMGRLKPGATIEQARASLDGMFQSLALELMPPPERENEPGQLEPKDYPQLIAHSGSRGMTEGREWFSPKIYLLWGVVGLVLLIACANVANLLLSRGAIRAPEITIRLAVGAGRWRLIRQLLTESLILASLGGAAGVLFALWGTRMLAEMSDRHGYFLPAEVDYSLNWRVLGFTVTISILTGLLFGMAPAWRATNLDLTTALKEGLSNISRSRLSRVLVIAQVAIVLLLLVGAGLFVRTLRNLQQVEVGFNQENLLLFTLQPRLNGYKSEPLVRLYRQLFARLDTIPGVRSATFANVPLNAGYIENGNLILPSETVQSGTGHITLRQIVRENYLTTMEIPLLSGRGFSPLDDKSAPRVVIISETLARRFFANEDPIGKHIGFNAETAGKVEIIGVARDVKFTSQREENEPLIYLPWLQNDDYTGEMQFALRTSGDPNALVNSARQVVREVDGNLPLVDVKTQAAQASEMLTKERLFARLLSFFGILALLLAAIGLYGVMAYSVAQRTNEIGIRMALGAQVGDILRLVIWQGLKLVLIGSVAGVLGVFALKEVIASKLYGVQPTDPLTFALVGGLLIVIALLACWIPARQAMKVDPVISMRRE